MTPRPGYRSLTIRADDLRALSDWRATREPIPTESEAVSLAIQWFVSSPPARRDRWVAEQRGDEPR